ncbi:MAG: tetratricopeptide repeat protein [Candidatus Eremiobacterota bacterium]
MSSEEKAYLLSGESYFNNGDYPRAIEEFNKAMKVTTSEARVRNNLGIAYARMGFFEKAVEELKSVLRLEPTHSTARFNLGVTVCELSRKYIESGRLDNAINILKDVSLIIPENPFPVSTMGIIYVIQDKKTEAVELLNKALSLCNSAQYVSVKKSVEEELKNLKLLS